MSVQLDEARGKLQKAQDEVGAIFKEAKGGGDDKPDYSKCKESVPSEIAGKSSAIADHVTTKMKEIDALTDEVKKYEALEGAEGKLYDLEKNPIKHMQHPGQPGNNSDVRPEQKGFGQQLVEHKGFKAWQENDKGGAIELEDFFIKTLFQTTAGWAPESVRLPGFIESAQRPVEVTDIIPSAPTGQAAIKYMEETTLTNAVAATAEGGAFAESALALTERSKNVIKIATFIPVTDEQLEDVAGVQAYLDQRLRFMLRQKLDSELLVGDRTASPEQIDGFLNVSGIQTQAKGADSTLDAIHKAITKVRVTGRAIPSHIIMHPNDWQQIRLTTTADGIYIFGPPSDVGVARIWGLPVVLSSAITEGTALIADFPNFTMLWNRRGITLKLSDSHSDYFVKGKQAMRADLRACLTVFRPAALCTVTGI